MRLKSVHIIFIIVSVGIFYRTKINMNKNQHIYFKELAQAMGQVATQKLVSQASWQETWEGDDVSVLRKNYFFRKHPFLRFRLSADWKRAIHIIKVIYFTKTNFKSISWSCQTYIQYAFTVICGFVFDYISWFYSLSKFNHITNHTGVVQNLFKEIHCK